MSPVRSDAASASYWLCTVTTCSRGWRASSDASASGKICVRPSGSAPTRNAAPQRAFAGGDVRADVAQVGEHPPEAERDDLSGRRGREPARRAIEQRDAEPRLEIQCVVLLFAELDFDTACRDESKLLGCLSLVAYVSGGEKGAPPCRRCCPKDSGGFRLFSPYRPPSARKEGTGDDELRGSVAKSRDLRAARVGRTRESGGGSLRPTSAAAPSRTESRSWRSAGPATALRNGRSVRAQGADDYAPLAQKRGTVRLAGCGKASEASLAWAWKARALHATCPACEREWVVQVVPSETPLWMTDVSSV